MLTRSLRTRSHLSCVGRWALDHWACSARTMWITPEGVLSAPQAGNGTPRREKWEAGDTQHDRVSRLPRLSALTQREASGLRPGLGPPSAPARSFSASASRTTSVVRPADWPDPN